MSGIGLVASIAKDALAAQRQGMNVTAHNIANVNSPGYSRQNPIYTAKEPAPGAGMLFGRGVNVSQIIRASDQFIENRLMEQKSDMFYSQEMENYVKVLEGVFNENSTSSVSETLVKFWNLWHDISNNPSGAPERSALYEQSALLFSQFNALNADITRLEVDLSNSISVGINRINLITDEIAVLNNEIVRTGTNSVANDLMDQRNMLLSELSEYIDTNAFEQDNGSMTVITARGGILVHGNSSYDLAAGGVNGDRVLWQGSGGTSLDITDHISKGVVGGSLDMRDEVLAKYKLELDGVAREFIWSVNQQHSQGVGLKLFDAAVTGTYATGASGLLATVAYGDKIDYTKDFKMWTYDSGSTSPVAVDVDMGISTANVTDWGGAFTTGGNYTIVVTQGGNIADYDGATKIKWNRNGGAWTTVNVAAATGIAVIDGNNITIDKDKALVAGNTFTFSTDAGKNADKLTLGAITGTANDILDTYTFTVTTAGTIGAGTPVLSWANSSTSGTISITAAGNYTVDGMTIPFTSGTLALGDTFTIATNATGTPTATVPSDWHWTLDSFADQFNQQTARVTATISANALTFAPDASGGDMELTNFVYSGGVTASNTTLTVNNYDTLDRDATDFQLSRTADNTWEVVNNPGYVVTLRAIDGADLDNGLYVDLDGTKAFTVTFNTAIATNGIVEFDIAYTTGSYSFAFSDDSAQDSGLTAALGINTFFTGTSAGDISINSIIAMDKDNITAARVSSDGTFSTGDNTNALAIADLQYVATTISQYSVDRISGITEGSITSTVEDYYHSFVGSIGNLSASISRGKDFNEAMVNTIREIRDGISAVSLDEEMANLIKYQHAYSAAAKLISVADEMLTTLLQIK